MGLFALVACSEDNFQETDKMNDTDVVENSSGGMQTNSHDPSVPYTSPYASVYQTTAINYTINNTLPEDILVVGHFGLAYYDGVNDGVNFGRSLMLAPNVYQNGQEYLNIINSGQITVPANTSTTGDGTSVPVYFHPNNLFFPVEQNLGGNAIQEDPEIIHQQGKLYFVDIDIPSIKFNTRIKVQFGDDFMDFTKLSSLTSNWSLLPGNIPGVSGDLVYEIGTKEICLIKDSSGNGLNSEDSFVYGGQTWYVRAYTDATGVYVTVTP